MPCKFSKKDPDFAAFRSSPSSAARAACVQSPCCPVCSLLRTIHAFALSLLQLQNPCCAVCSVLRSRQEVQQAALADVIAVRERDPACTAYSSALLYYKGYHALQTHRIAHGLWERGQTVLARSLQVLSPPPPLPLPATTVPLCVTAAPDPAVIPRIFSWKVKGFSYNPLQDPDPTPRETITVGKRGQSRAQQVAKGGISGVGS